MGGIELPRPAEPTLAEIETKILAAVRELGREPTLERIARKAGVRLQTARDVNRFFDALDRLIARRELIHGTHGGLRLPGN
ncbi:MAG TPA: hypothetical protein VFU47_00580 [Armatimonadota bacterium]|nr:hypothetical protein [Armatimonadota bacterium]